MLLPEIQGHDRRCDVLIAGGSYAGLALALALASEAAGDLRVIVVSPTFPNSAAQPQEHSDVRGSALSRGSLNLLTRVGVWPTLASHAQTVAEIVLTDSDLEDVVRPEMLRYSLDTDPAVPEMVIAENGKLGAALYDAACIALGVNLKPSLSVTSFEPKVDAVLANLSDGTTISARLLVAADGARSALRTQAGIATMGWPYAQIGIVTIVEPKTDHGGRAVQHFLPAGPFALLPMTGNRVCVTWTEEAGEARRILMLDKQSFAAEVERRFGPELGALTTISVPQSWPLEISIARELTHTRLALIGDAAHTLHPIAGQGLNLGLRDVAALAETVIDTARLGLDIGSPETLARYARARRFDNLASAAGFDALNRLFSTPSTLARSARGAALSVIDRLPNLKQLIIAEAAGQSGDVPRLLRPLI